MMQLMAVALGGALGALSRYGLSGLLNSPLTDGKIPVGTLTVNLLGSLLMGAIYVLMVEKAMVPEAWRQVLMVGFLGAFTTFSTFSLETLLLWQQGYPWLALAYTLLSLGLCIAGISLAVFFVRLL